MPSEESECSGKQGDIFGCGDVLFAMVKGYYHYG